MAKNRILTLLAVVIVALLSGIQTTYANNDDCPTAYPVDPPTLPNGSWGFMVPTTFQPSGHTGLDWMLPAGTPVYASGSGTVTWASWWPAEMTTSGHGPTVWILHESCDGSQLSSVYAHLDKDNIQVSVGQEVQRGTLLGYVGPDGESGAGQGSHLHYAKNLGGNPDLGNNHGGVWVDPMPVEANTSLQAEEPAEPPQVLGLPTQDLNQIPLPIWILAGVGLVFALGLVNRNTRGVAALSLLVIFVAGFAWLFLHEKIEPITFLNQPQPVTPPTPLLISNLDQKGAGNGEGWKIIQQAVTDAGGTTDQAKLLYWTWQSETAVVDCKPWETKFAIDGLPNACVSKAYAKGPFQFMDGTWARYEGRGWDKWTLYGASRGAFEEFTRLNLWDLPDAQSFANRFSGADGGQVWNNGPDGHNQALWIFSQYQTTEPNN